MRPIRPTYSSITSTLALFAALGGTSYAVSALPAGSVGRNQIRDGAVTGAKVRNQSLTHRDIKNGSVIGRSVFPGSLGTREIGEGSLNGGDIADGSLTGADVADASIGPEKLRDLPKAMGVPSDAEPGVASLRTLGAGPRQAVAGDDGRLSDARVPSGAAGGALRGSFPNPGLADGAVTSASVLDGTVLSSDLADGLKDGAAGTATLRSLGTSATQAAAGDDARLSNARTPTGAAGGALSGSFPSPGLADGAVTSASVLDGTLLSSDFDDDLEDGDAGTPTLRSLGTGATQAAAGDDTRLSDTRVPTDGSVVPASFGALPAVNATATTLQSFTSGATTRVALDSTRHNAGTTFANAADQIVIQTPGVYALDGLIDFDTNNAGIRLLTLNSNRGEIAAMTANAVTDYETILNVHSTRTLQAGDIIFLLAAQNSGGAVATSTSSSGSGASLSATYVAPAPAGAQRSRAPGAGNAARLTQRELG